MIIIKPSPLTKSCLRPCKVMSLYMHIFPNWTTTLTAAPFVFEFGLSSDDYKKLVFGTTLPTSYKDLRTTHLRPDPSDIVV